MKQENAKKQKEKKINKITLKTELKTPSYLNDISGESLVYYQNERKIYNYKVGY